MGRYSCLTKPGLEESSVVLYTDDSENLAAHTGRKKVLVLILRLICYTDDSVHLAVHTGRKKVLVLIYSDLPHSTDDTGNCKRGGVNNPTLPTNPPRWEESLFLPPIQVVTPRYILTICHFFYATQYKSPQISCQKLRWFAFIKMMSYENWVFNLNLSELLCLMLNKLRQLEKCKLPAVVTNISSVIK